MDCEINKTLVLSTGHVLLRDSEWLESEGYLTKYGFYFWAGEGSDLEELFDGRYSLVKIAKLAIKNGCEYIYLDKDGPIVEELAFFDWEEEEDE